MSSQLNEKLFTGAAWMLLTRGLIKSLGLVSSIVLARLLAPSDFGLIAIAMSFYAFILLFGSVGFNSALVQKSDASDHDFDVVWTIGVVFGAIAACVFVLSANSIAQYFNDERLTPVVYSIAILFLLNGFVNTAVVKFQKELNFKRELKFQLIPKLISFFSTLFLAYILKNYWALVWGMLIHQLMITVTSYLMTHYKPSFRVTGAGQLFKFSKWIMLNQFFYYINNRSMDLIVGKLISTRATGIYSISLEIASIPVTEVVAPINKAAYPAYAKAQKDLLKLQELFLQTIGLIAFFSVPAVMGLSLIADIFVPVVLGDKWKDAIPIIQYVGISSLFLGLSSNAGYLLIAIGKPHLSTLNGFIRTLLLMSSAIIMISYYGLEGAAMGMILSSFIGCGIAYIFVSYYAKINVFSVVRVFIRPFLAATFMALALFFIKKYTFIDTDLISLIIAVSIGIFFYGTSIIMLWLFMGKPQGIESSLAVKVRQFTSSNI
jgi:O-antigen/teichoic acid export membrane protein